jgi:hypothetical protein
MLNLCMRQFHGSLTRGVPKIRPDYLNSFYTYTGSRLTSRWSGPGMRGVFMSCNQGWRKIIELIDSRKGILITNSDDY